MKLCSVSGYGNDIMTYVECAYFLKLLVVANDNVSSIMMFTLIRELMDCSLDHGLILKEKVVLC